MTRESGLLSSRLNWPRRLYDWILSFADRPTGHRALFLVAFSESFFFPVPPDVLLIPLAVGAPRRALWFSTISTLGSLLGAIVGYWLGFQFYEVVGKQVVEFYAASEQFDEVQSLFQEWDAVAVAVAGFTPIPFKVFTISAGLFKINLWTFLLATLFSRGVRFFLVGGLIAWFGSGIQLFIDRYFNYLTVLFVILTVVGFLILKYAI